MGKEKGGYNIKSFHVDWEAIESKETKETKDRTILDVFREYLKENLEIRKIDKGDWQDTIITVELVLSGEVISDITIEV